MRAWVIRWWSRLALVIACGLSIVSLGLAWLLTHTDDGDARAWLAVPQLVLAAVIGWSTVSYQRFTMKWNLTEQDRRQRHQAEMVAAWCTAIVPESRMTSVTHVEIYNGSDQPIYGAAAYLHTDDTTPGLGLLINQGPDGGLTIIGPKQSRSVSIEQFHGQEPTRDPSIYLVFTDAQGRHWERRPRGELSQTEYNPLWAIRDHHARFTTDPGAGES